MIPICITVLFGLIPCAATELDQYDEPLVVTATPDWAEPIVLNEAPIVRPASPQTDEASVYEADDALYGDTAPIDDTDERGYPEDEYAYGYEAEQYGYDDDETSFDFSGYYEDELTLSTEQPSSEEELVEDDYAYSYDDDETSFDFNGYYEDELTLSTDEFSPEDESVEDEYEGVYDEYRYGENDGSVGDDGSGVVEPWQAAATVDDAVGDEAGDAQYAEGGATDNGVDGEYSDDGPDDYGDGDYDYDYEDEYSDFENSYEHPDVESGSHEEYPYDDGYGEDAQPQGDGTPIDETPTIVDAAWRTVRQFVVSLPELLSRLTK